jgi:hypothetical protein
LLCFDRLIAKGFGGWLILFQLRLYSSVINLLIIPRLDVVLVVLFVAMLAACLVLFYMRRRAFRIVCIIIAVLIAVIGVIGLPHTMPYFVSQLVIEGLIIIALFRARRVDNTFY